MKAIVNVPVCPLYSRPDRQCTLEDEALFGMVVEILDEAAPGWLKIRTHYRYEGIVCDEDLLLDDEAVDAWEAMPKKVVLNKNFCDVLSAPKVQGWIIKTLPLGSLVAPVAEAENGWVLVQLPDGETGYVMDGILGEYFTEPAATQEEDLRSELVKAALRYQNTHYRWGGKSTHGIDCSGLCSMAYMLCGILIYRDAKIVEGFPLHPIELEDAKPGDLLFFPGHVAMYLGNGRYCHSTAKASGFAFNSLNPADSDYREDLHRSLNGVASYF